MVRHTPRPIPRQAGLSPPSVGLAVARAARRPCAQAS
jgi:hypothetical protein